MRPLFTMLLQAPANQSSRNGNVHSASTDRHPIAPGAPSATNTIARRSKEAMPELPNLEPSSALILTN
ncbi:MAG: hypothetical protein CBB71_01090 [Rhodopirellula sp. TMED11]|nr:MAG: hypothetical protein CBB71_01090 [Rhodopirellula sp. TMED11]